MHALHTLALPCNRQLVRGAHVADLCCRGQELSLRVGEGQLPEPLTTRL